MSLRQVFSAFAFCVLSAFPVSHAKAQDATGAEIADRFREQLRLIQGARADPSTSRTRGLVLVPVAPAEAEAGSGDETLLTLAPEAAPGPDAVWTLPPDKQVNVRITFAFDSAALGADQKPKLREVCGALGEAGVGVLKIIGHTDASGPWDYNQQLSELRAEEVKRFFVTDCGVPENRLEAVGVGEQFPYDTRNPGASVNRRVEFQAVS